jgi:hypothetical protein
MSLTTNLARPKTSAIITVRVIKSFDFRTERSLVLRDINLETTTIGYLKTIVRDGDNTTPLTSFASTRLPLRPKQPFRPSPGGSLIALHPLVRLRSETPSLPH